MGVEVRAVSASPLCSGEVDDCQVAHGALALGLQVNDRVRARGGLVEQSGSCPDPLRRGGDHFAESKG